MKTTILTALVAVATGVASAAHAQSGKDVIAVQIKQASRAWLTARAEQSAKASESGSDLSATGITTPAKTASAECICPVAASYLS